MPPQLWCEVLRHLGANDAACLAAAAPALCDLVRSSLPQMDWGDWLAAAAADARPEPCRWVAEHAPVPPDPWRAFLNAFARCQLAMCEYLLAHYRLAVADCPNLVECLKRAARGGHLRACEWLVAQPHAVVDLIKRNDKALLQRAAKSGNIHLCQWMVAATQPSRDTAAHALAHAAHHGHLEVCQWFRRHFELTGEQVQLGGALQAAAGGGHLHVCRWLVDGVGLCIDALNATVGLAVQRAGEAGHLHVCRWLTSGCTHAANNLVMFYNILPMFRHAADKGLLDVCQWVEQRFPIEWYLMYHMVLGSPPVCIARNADLCRWLVQHFGLDATCVGRRSDLLFSCACEHGHLALCQWLAERFKLTVCTANAFGCAARGGHLRVCQFLKRHFRLTQGTLVYLCSRKDVFQCVLEDVAQDGQLRVCRWMVAAGLVVLDAHGHGRALRAAARGGHLAVCRWLASVAHAPCLRTDLEAALCSGARKGDLATCQWIYSQFPPTPTIFLDQALVAAMANAAELGNLAVCEWLASLLSGACDVGVGVLRAAVSGGDVSVCRFVADVVPLLDAKMAVPLLRVGAEKGHLAVCQWLAARYGLGPHNVRQHTICTWRLEGTVERVLQWLRDHFRPQQDE